MKRHLFTFGLYVAIAAGLSACAEGFSQKAEVKKANGPGDKSGAGVSITRAGSAVTISADKFSVKINSMEVRPATGEESDKYKSTTENTALEYFSVTMNSAVNVGSGDQAAVFQTFPGFNASTANPALKHRVAVGQKVESGWSLTMFTMCDDEKGCSTVWARLVLLVMSNEGDVLTTRECGLQVSDTDNSITQVKCLDEGQSFDTVENVRTKMISAAQLAEQISD